MYEGLIFPEYSGSRSGLEGTDERHRAEPIPGSSRTTHDRAEEGRGTGGRDGAVRRERRGGTVARLKKIQFLTDGQTKCQRFKFVKQKNETQFGSEYSPPPPTLCCLFRE